MDVVYRRSGLIKNYKKAVRGAGVHDFWGAQLDGEAGRVSGPPLRLISVAVISASVARLGYASALLLHTLSGIWTSLIMFRRRCLCLLDLVFDATRGRRAGDVLELSGPLRSELLTLSILAPLMFTNLRARTSPVVGCVDASTRKRAVCVATLCPFAVRELSRHAIRRGRWTRLLSPYGQWARAHGELDPVDELPEQDTYGTSPLWTSMARAVQYTVAMVEQVSGHPHINISEIRALIMREMREDRLGGRSARLLDLGDSQVAAGALAKGRSSSPSINLELQASLAILLGSDLYHASAFVASGDNAADDPTRDRPLRAAAVEQPIWLQALLMGEPGPLDDFLTLSGDPGYALHADLPDLAAVVAESMGVPPGGPLPVGPDVVAAVGDAGPAVPSAQACVAAERGAGVAAAARAGRGPGVATSAGVPLAADTSLTRTLQPLSPEAVELIYRLDEALIRRSPTQAAPRAWPPREPGILILARDGRRMLKAAWSEGCQWAVLIDPADLASPDHGTASLAASVASWLEAGLFLLVVAMPPCSSMSTAISPPIRSHEHPYGAPSAPSALVPKIRADNRMAAALSFLAAAATSHGVAWSIVGPASSWMWKLGPVAVVLAAHGAALVDCCCFGAPWRKRLRIASSLRSLANVRVFCSCKSQHVALRGRIFSGGPSRTAVADALPHGLARALVALGLQDAIGGRSPPPLDAFAQAAVARNVFLA